MFLTNLVRPMTTKTHLYAATPNWASYTVLAAIISAPVALWLLHDGTGNVPDLDEETSSTERGDKLITGPTPKEVTEILDEDAYTVLIGHFAKGATRYDGAQLSAESPCEDRYTHGSIEVLPGEKWLAWVIFDGYNGPQMAELLSRELVPAVRDSLKDYLPTLQLNPHGETRDKSIGLSEPVHSDLVREAMTKAFQELDGNFMASTAFLADAYGRAENGDSEHLGYVFSESPYADQVRYLLNTLSGSCALVCMYDPKRETLQVANTGSSRAVLGYLAIDNNRREPVWRTHPMSTDQTSYDPQEARQILDNHPGEEETVFWNGRLFGRLASRAFGDYRLKLPQALQWVLYRNFAGEPHLIEPIKEVKTPPYMNVNPSTSVIKIGKTPCFLIIASDGFWARMKSEDAVELVSYWLLAGNIALNNGHPGTLKDIDMGRFIRHELRNPNELPRSFVPYLQAPYSNDLMTIQDGNVAVHLLRNALGGSDEKVLTTQLALQPPFALASRGDMTVQVVFFNMDGEQLLKP
ncbi:hypothetical protein SBRCBS47491_008014 [Sporothrix bragantina]|uniref:PPM-type phosphatase domain-containing protein n=1 Tax=Sporothrix bragantina TaxID=671064 RepID=A0ABP0CIB5_9PEZI